MDAETFKEAQRLQKLEEQEIEKFYVWQKAMWINLKKNIRKRELENRPKYIQQYDESVGKHLENYFITLKSRVRSEAEAKESMWEDPKGIVEFRKHLKYILNADNIKNDDFIEHLLIVKDKEERQDIYFDQVKDLIFPFIEKKLDDKINDNEVGVGPIELDNDDQMNQTYFKELMNLRGKSEFLQKKITGIYKTRN